ncbi:hypothetical protein SPHINGO361_90003 [Sphingomonas sp. EC-HK361]|nr:hypothetical protein SPHINGO361_90003 [Sphingomonas sp. EC-HK361]
MDDLLDRLLRRVADLLRAVADVLRRRRDRVGLQIVVLRLVHQEKRADHDRDQQHDPDENAGAAAAATALNDRRVRLGRGFHDPFVSHAFYSLLLMGAQTNGRAKSFLNRIDRLRTAA